MSIQLPENTLLDYLPNADLLELDRVPYLWNINSIELGAQSMSVSGWALPHRGITDSTSLLVNGQAANISRHEKPAGVYAELYPWYPNSAFAGFKAVIPLSGTRNINAEEFEIEAIDQAHPLEMTTYKLSILRSDLSFAIPDAEIAARIGVGEPLHYTMFGRSIYRAFDAALRKATGQGFEGATNIVDWGSGSGRVARHVVSQLRSDQSFTGFDIDEPAVNWSNTHIGSHFKICNLEPQLNYPAQTADVVFAYSVFTHMAEAAFHAWLDELSRILKPGGTLMFTVLGDFAMAALAPGFPKSAHENWIKTGIYDVSGNSQLETIGVGGDFYRNTWVKRAFIDRALSKAGLKRVDYVSPAHFYQDLVVAKHA